MAETLPTEVEKYLNVPYEERWEKFKPVIVDLYMGSDSTEPMTIPKLAEFMRDKYSFHAQPPHYRHRFRKWDVRKRTLTKEKENITKVVGKRKLPSASTSDVMVRQGGAMKQVNKKQLKRFLNDQIRHANIESLSPGVFSQWNLPYSAFIASFVRRYDQPSPFGSQSDSPTDITINSPNEALALTSQGSPTVQLIQKRTHQTRASLFAQGRTDELLIQCNQQDRRIIIDWLYDYWLHTYITSKYWGRGPQQWTAGTITEFMQRFRNRQNSGLLSPLSLVGTPTDTSRSRSVACPTHLCRWAIHHEDEVEVDEIIEVDDHESQRDFVLHNTSSWPQWPEAVTSPTTLQSSMSQAFEDNLFSQKSMEELPIASKTIAESMKRSPEALEMEAWTFAIMSGNVEYIKKYNEAYGAPECIKEIHPYHLAASFLDGANTCCNMIDALKIGLHFLPMRYGFDKNGHTIFDSLVISIIRSHTNLTPAEVSGSFRDRQRFPGEEKDICGRWDADHPSFQELHRLGIASIPQSWKHMFCHTSTQAVCHSLITVRADLRAQFSSGLFSRLCTSCGLQLKLGIIHVMVVLAFYLASRGKDGETLFGVVAMLVCFLAIGADTREALQISVNQLFNDEANNGCDHEFMTAAERAGKVPQERMAEWTPTCRIGWRCFCLILQSDQDGVLGCCDSSEVMSDDDTNIPCSLHSNNEELGETIPCRTSIFGTLWATIQTELLTYRRITDMDPWVSPNFDMTALSNWLSGETKQFDTPLINEGLMNTSSPCGWFEHPHHDLALLFPEGKHVSNRYFMNMDIWSRASFIPPNVDFAD